MRRFDIEPYLAAIERLKITNLAMVPPLVIAIINSPLSNKYSLKSVRAIAAGAAPLDALSQRRFQALCHPEAVFTQVMGMTETTSAICLYHYPDSDETGSVGNTFLPNTDVKCVTCPLDVYLRHLTFVDLSMTRGTISQTTMYEESCACVGRR
jgi:acyl-CoA synthetase (AMP-forming)/AMP-acid ligase II